MYIFRGFPARVPVAVSGGNLPPSPSPRGKIPAFGSPFGAVPAGIPRPWGKLTPLVETQIGRRLYCGVCGIPYHPLQEMRLLPADLGGQVTGGIRVGITGGFPSPCLGAKTLPADFLFDGNSP
ncbi:hypothetical protein PIB30_112107, partial [Stylosanthes scabra]|nr:hypothetical protein [Stylosanthes scabra]